MCDRFCQLFIKCNGILTNCHKVQMNPTFVDKSEGGVSEKTVVQLVSKYFLKLGETIVGSFLICFQSNMQNK